MERHSDSIGTIYGDETDDSDITKVKKLVTLGTPFGGSPTAGGASDLGISYPNVALGISKNVASLKPDWENTVYPTRRSLAENALLDTKVFSAYGRDDVFVPVDSDTKLINVPMRNQIIIQGYDAIHIALTKQYQIINDVNYFLLQGEQ